MADYCRHKVSTSRTQIVAGSKMLHHFLPDPIPPIDRQYTFSFFTGRKMVSDDHTAFLDWFRQLASIGTPPDHLLAARKCLTEPKAVSRANRRQCAALGVARSGYGAR